MSFPEASCRFDSSPRIRSSLFPGVPLARGASPSLSFTDAAAFSRDSASTLSASTAPAALASAAAAVARASATRVAESTLSTTSAVAAVFASRSVVSPMERSYSTRRSASVSISIASFIRSRSAATCSGSPSAYTAMESGEYSSIRRWWAARISASVAVGGTSRSS